MNFVNFRFYYTMKCVCYLQGSHKSLASQEYSWVSFLEGYIFDWYFSHRKRTAFADIADEIDVVSLVSSRPRSLPFRVLCLFSCLLIILLPFSHVPTLPFTLSPPLPPVISRSFVVYSSTLQLDCSILSGFDITHRMCLRPKGICTLEELAHEF